MWVVDDGGGGGGDGRTDEVVITITSINAAGLQCVSISPQFMRGRKLKKENCTERLSDYKNITQQTSER